MTLRKRIATRPDATPRAGEELPEPVVGADGHEVPRRLQVTDDAPANVLWRYRLVALDAAGNESEASAPVTGRAYQVSPEPPELAEPAWDAFHQQVKLEWTAPDPDLETRVERRAGPGTSWQVAAAWLPRGQYSYLDTPPDPAAVYDYRLKVRDSLGQVNSTYQIRTTP